MTTPKVKNRFSPRESIISPGGEGRSQQQFAKLCDINHIMAKFNQSGSINHASTSQPQWVDVPSITLHEAMNITAQAQTAFAGLPSNIRNYFKNDPILLNQFLENEDNREKAIELGLITKGAESAPAPSGTAQPAEEGAGGQESATPPEETTVSNT